MPDSPCAAVPATHGWLPVGSAGIPVGDSVDVLVVVSVTNLVMVVVMTMMGFEVILVVRCLLVVVRVAVVVEYAVTRCVIEGVGAVVVDVVV